jgi:multidrug efflux pump subunit AcrA (membrane-fusion protein)
MTKRFYLVFLLGVLSACQHNESTVDANKKSNAVKVTTKTVMLMKDDYDLRYSGTIEPVQSVALTFNGTGTVESVFVNEGDMVKKGQALASLDKTKPGMLMSD